MPGDSGPSEAALTSAGVAEGAVGAAAALGAAGLAAAARAAAQGLGGSTAGADTATGATDTLTQAEDGDERRGPAALSIICTGGRVGGDGPGGGRVGWGGDRTRVECRPARK